jgi:hypothetical protein
MNLPGAGGLFIVIETDEKPLVVLDRRRAFNLNVYVNPGVSTFAGRARTEVLNPAGT